MDIAIWQALDGAETSGVAATLSGLSISASSFLANLAKTQAEAAKASKHTWEEKKDAAAKAPLSLKAAHQEIERAAKTTYEKDRAIADESASAMKMLLLAFALFTLDLVESLTFDPIVDKQTLDSAVQSVGYTYAQLVPFDVGFGGITLAAGIALLCMSAKRILNVIPKID